MRLTQILQKDYTTSSLYYQIKLPLDVEIMIPVMLNTSHGWTSVPIPGNYTGEISCTYRIVRADISKAKATVKAQVYTGKTIEPGKSDITLKVGKTTLSPNEYEIVSYSNNVRKGTATVVVQGKGNYGGTKTIKFKIKSKVFSWWWR